MVPRCHPAKEQLEMDQDADTRDSLDQRDLRDAQVEATPDSVPQVSAMFEPLLERLAIHRRNLAYLLHQAALYGIRVPLAIVNEIVNEREHIQQIKVRLSSAGIAIPDAPDDLSGIHS
jgi:hypothetical protein